MVEDVSAPRLVGTGSTADPPDPPDPPDPRGPVGAGRVPLHRLLTAVTLSPAEASLVAVRLLESVHEARASTDALSDERWDRWTVALTYSGAVEVTRAEGTAGVALDHLLGQLCRNARRLPTHPPPGQLVLLRRLEEVASDAGQDIGARVARLEVGLVEVLGPGASVRLGAQLADLVQASAHLTPRPRAPLAVVGTPAAVRPATRPTHPRRRGRTSGRRRVPGRRAAALVLLLVAVAAGSGYVLTRGGEDATAGADVRDPSTTAPGRDDPARTSPRPSRRPSPRPRFESLAPRQAGAITGVELRPVGDCGPGALCAVTATVRLRPASDVRVVTWRVGTATSCRGDLTWSAPVGVGAQPGWTSVYASSSVQIPRGRPAVLVATTATPARAQSPPVPVAGSSLSC